MTNALKNSSTWYEKSVEYQFVANALKAGAFSLLAPLDGTLEEALGDAVIVNEANFFLIEFKRYRTSLTSEYVKYRSEHKSKDGPENFKAAAQALSNYASLKFHIYIYGKSIKSSNSPSIAEELELQAADYFSMEDISNDPIIMLTKGASMEDFNSYTSELAKWRQFEEEDEKSSTGSGSMVFGISNSSKRALILSLKEYTSIRPKPSPKISL